MTPIRVVAAVVQREGRWLLGQRPLGKRHSGLWEFPGGKLDSGEEPLEAARRELAEEITLEVVSMGPLAAAIVDESSPFIIEFYPVEAIGDPVALEHAALGWFTPEEAAALPLAPADAAFVSQQEGFAANPRPGPSESRS